MQNLCSDCQGAEWDELMAHVYQRWISPWLHSASGFCGACRFQPTCSEYAITALAHRGLLRGVTLTLWRVLRCHPFCNGGFDPVPGTYPVTADQPRCSRTDDPRHLP